MSNVLPFGPTQSAEFADKRYESMRVRCALRGAALYRHVGADGAVTYAIGLNKFQTIDQVESFFDTISDDGDETRRP